MLQFYLRIYLVWLGIKFFKLSEKSLREPCDHVGNLWIEVFGGTAGICVALPWVRHPEFTILTAKLQVDVVSHGPFLPTELR